MIKIYVTFKNGMYTQMMGRDISDALNKIFKIFLDLNESMIDTIKVR